MAWSMDERKAQLVAHKAAVDAVRSELEKVKDDELEALRHQSETDLGMLFVVELYSYIYWPGVDKLVDKESMKSSH